MVDVSWSVDSWAEVDEEEYCYKCADFVIPDKGGHCPDCLEYIAYGSEFNTSSTATTTVADAPAISSDGDMWGRSKGYTWGKSTNSWWNKGSSTGKVSSMWGSWGGGYNRDGSAARMLKHKNHLDSLCKVVNPTVKHTLSFAYEGASWSEIGKGKIVIDGSLLKDSDDNLDITAGLAIHEKLHLIHTKPIVQWEKEYKYEKGLDNFQYDLLHSIVNTIEDEYIEKQLAKDNAGFVTYIESTKDYYFNKKQDDDKYSISNINENAYIDILNTLLAFVRYPSMIDDNRKRRHAKHIRFFGRALKNGLDSREDTIKCCQTLYEYLNVIAEKMYDDKELTDQHKEELKERMEELRDKLKDDVPEEIYDKIEQKMEDDFRRDLSSKSSVQKILELYDGVKSMKEIMKILDYKPEAHLDKDLIKKMDELEETDYEEFELELGKVIDSAQKKITWRKAKPDDMGNYRYKQGKKRMKTTINSLKKKINLYGNTEKHIIRNQKRGKLDKRNLHRIPLDRKDLFKIDMIREDKPLDVCLLVDESGSMGGETMEEARDTCIAVKEALVDNDKLDLWVFGHTADGEEGWHSDEGSTNMTTYWSPSMKDRPMAMGMMDAKYENRDGNAILAAAQKVKMESKEPTSNKLMIIFSDGSPAASEYGGYNAKRHVRKSVKFAESQGWSIIQVGFGSGRLEEVQKDMFDNHIFIKDTSQIGNKVSRVIRKVLRV